jgi:subtilisin family serine protease
MTHSRVLASLVATIAVAAFTIHLSGAQQASVGKRRFIVVAKSAGDAAALRADVVSAGGTIVTDLTDQTGALVVSGPDTMRARLARSAFASAVAVDGIKRLIRGPQAQELLNFGHGLHGGFSGRSGRRAPIGDPAFGLQGLMWNLTRIDAPAAWKTSVGSGEVTVGVADTGLDFTHTQLAHRVVDVVDFTATEDPPICSTYFGASDADLAAYYGGPATTDWNGHGSWIGGTIAAELDRLATNGIAPKVKLVALKISQWCGSAYDSELIAAFIYAADHHIDVVNISFGGYTDRTDPDQEAVYQQYVSAVRYARRKGTIIVAAAGNEHVRVGEGGKVLSHGSLTTPGDPVSDLFGLYETPGGIPGVIDVSATNNVVVGPSAFCPAPGPDDDPLLATCKPATDVHQPKGVGLENQLSYYSNYGPRIDVGAPGGARKFNIPGYDRGGTPGWPYTEADGFNAYEAFSITSNFAVEIPCFPIAGEGFPNVTLTEGPSAGQVGECYSGIQGTSMAAPHTAGVLALIASANPRLRHNPGGLIEELLEGATGAHNRTQALSATDLSPGDLTGVACATGYCHLGGPSIADGEAYGAGVINADDSVDEHGRH